MWSSSAERCRLFREESLGFLVSRRTPRAFDMPSDDTYTSQFSQRLNATTGFSPPSKRTDWCPSDSAHPSNRQPTSPTISRPVCARTASVACLRAA